MTVSTTTATILYSGNGATTLFTFPFSGVAADDISVIYTDTSGTVTVLDPITYTLVLNPAAVGQLWGIGGSVTYPISGSPIPVGSTLRIDRTLPYTQTVSISNQGAFYPQAVETALDKLEFQIQQISDPEQAAADAEAAATSAANSAASAAADAADAAVDAASAAASAALAGRYDIDTMANAVAATIPGGYTFIRLAGYLAVGDAQEPLVYRKVGSAPSHSLYFQSADGAYWEYTPGTNGVNVAATSMVASKTTTYSATNWNKLAPYILAYTAATSSVPFLNIFIPQGTYKLTASIVWDPTIGGINGYGADLEFQTNGAHGISVTPSSPPSGQWYEDVRSVCAGLLILGNSHYANEHGIRFLPGSYDAAGVVFRDCAIKGWHHGIHFVASTHNVEFDHCNIYFNYYGIVDTVGGANEGENMSFIGCNIFNNQVSGIYLGNVNSSYFFTNCSIDYNGLGGTGNPDSTNFKIGQVYQITFQGCHIETSTSVMSLGLGGGGNYKAVFSGCAIIQISSSGATIFLDVQNGCFMTLIGNNCVFNNSTSTPIKVEAGGRLVDIDNIFAYGGVAITYAVGSFSGSLNPTTAH